MLSVKQGGIKYYFLVFSVTRHGIKLRFSQAIGEHSKHCANGPVKEKLIRAKDIKLFLSMLDVSKRMVLHKISHRISKYLSSKEVLPM